MIWSHYFFNETNCDIWLGHMNVFQVQEAPGKDELLGPFQHNESIFLW